MPPEYVLQPRQHGSKYEDYSTWEKEIERPLVSVLEKAALQAGLDEEALAKYRLSATGQEIENGAMKVKDAQEHVFAFFRSIENPDELPNSDECRAFIEPDPELKQRQLALKNRLKARLPDNIYEYNARWTEPGLSEEPIGSLPEILQDCLKLNNNGDAPENLCEAVWLRLSQVILYEISKIETVDALEREQQAHADFGEDRAKHFVGREHLLAQITDYLAGKDYAGRLGMILARQPVLAVPQIRC